jgi:hypothetical protein
MEVYSTGFQVTIIVFIDEGDVRVGIQIYV